MKGVLLGLVSAMVCTEAPLVTGAGATEGGRGPGGDGELAGGGDGQLVLPSCGRLLLLCVKSSSRFGGLVKIRAILLVWIRLCS